MAEKPHMNLVFIGHVDHGKSTLVGRILYDTGSLDDNQLRKLKEEAEKVGKKTFEFAFAMDKVKEERERGVTIDLAHQKFETSNKYFTIIDAPGHKDFVKNMITGASQADAAVLVVDVKDGVQPQTKEHSFLARTLGIKQLIVAVNKMDSVDYSQDKYEKVKKQVSKLLKSIGYKPDNVPFVPVSAYEGSNAVEKDSDNTPWYKGETITSLLNDLEAPDKPVDKPMRMPIQDVYTIKGIGTVPVGRIETGIMKKGQSIVVMPSGKKGEVKSIEMHHQEMDKAEPGDNVGINVRGIGKKDITRGSVIGPANNPPTVIKEFTAQMVVLQHPSAITPGYTPVFHCHTSQTACEITKILKKMDPKTGEVKEENPDFIKTGDVAIVKVRPTRPLVAESSKEIPELGKFAVRDMGRTVAAGTIQDITEKDE